MENLPDYIGPEIKHLLVPRGTPGLVPMTIDMSEIYRIENRIPEIVRSTATTFPSLVTDFNMALAQLGHIIGRIELEKRDASRGLEEAEAVALLDNVEDILKAKNVKSSTDTRAAAIVLDEGVKEYKKKVDILSAMVSLLNSKYKALEMAYYSSKKICELQSERSTHQPVAAGGDPTVYNAPVRKG